MSDLGTSLALWCLRFLLLGGLILLIGWVGMLFIRQPIYRQRLGVWTVGVALLALPLCALPGWLPLPWNVPVPTSFLLAEAATSTVTVLEANTEQSAPKVLFLPQELPLEAPVIVHPTPPPEPNASTVETPAKQWDRTTILAWSIWGMVGLYALMVVYRLISLVLGQFALDRLWKQSEPAPIATRLELSRLAIKQGLSVEVRRNRKLGSPICFGVLSPRIVIPWSMAESGDRNTLRWVFAHELNHLVRRDPLTGWLIGLAQSVYFVWPWMNRLRQAIHLNQEYLADAAAVESQNTRTSAEDYASFLVQLVESTALALGAVAVKSSSSQLFRRITMVLNRQEKVQQTSSRRWSVGIGVSLFCLGVLFSSFTLPSQAALSDDPPKEEKKTDKKPEKADDKEKKPQTPEEIKKKLEDAIKNLDLNDPKYDEIIKQYEKQMEDLRKKGQANPVNPMVPDIRNRLKVLPPIVGPQDDAEFRKAMDLLQKQMQEMMLDQGLGRGGIFVPNQGRLGVRVEQIGEAMAEQLNLPDGQGLLIIEVRPDSVASKIGLKVNDIVLNFDGKEVKNDPADFVKMVREAKADKALEIIILRKGKKETLKDVKLPELKVQAVPQLDDLNPEKLIENLLRLQQDRQELIQGLLNNELGDNVKSARMSVQLVDGELKIESVQDGRTITIQGTKDAEDLKIKQIIIKEGDKETKADSVEQVPDKYRDEVKKILKQVSVK